MSTFKEIISRVDECRPNAFSKAVKFRWLTQLEGKIAADVFLMSITEIRALPRKYPDDIDKETLVDFPHDDIYDAWLEAKIDAENGEYNKYQNSMELYNECYGNFVRWFASVYEPAQGGQTGRFCIRPDVPTYYITAYGLAVKHGYRGTVEEWLASLKGPKGDPGKSAYQYAQEAGYTGTEEEYAEHMTASSKTAYEYAVEGGYEGTVEEFREKLAMEYAAQEHKHDAGDVTEGTLPVARLPVVPILHGGHGATTAEKARANLGIDDASNLKKGIMDSERLPVVPMSKGGTGAENAETARSNLGADDAGNLSKGTLDPDRLPVVPVTKGGTDATDAATARGNLGADDAGNLSKGTLNAERLPTIPVKKGGTGSTNGATGLKNLLAAGNTILSSYQYGTSLPADSEATKGRIFFLKA